MKNQQKIIQAKKARRIQRIRTKIFGTRKTPRLAATKTNKNFWLQLIDDNQGRTLLALSQKNLDPKFKGTKTEAAYKLGELLAEKAKKLGFTRVVLDRRGSKFHGRIKALAEGAKKQGLQI